MGPRTMFLYRLCLAKNLVPFLIKFIPLGCNHLATLVLTQDYINKFNGTNVKSWLRQPKQYYLLNQVPLNKKVTLDYPIP